MQIPMHIYKVSEDYKFNGCRQVKIRDLIFTVYTTNPSFTNYCVTSRKNMVCNIEICFRKYSKSMKTCLGGKAEFTILSIVKIVNYLFKILVLHSFSVKTS